MEKSNTVTKWRNQTKINNLNRSNNKQIERGIEIEEKSYLRIAMKKMSSIGKRMVSAGYLRIRFTLGEGILEII